MVWSTIALFCLVTMGFTLVDAEDAAVLIKTSNAVDVEALKNLKGTSAVYKVKLIESKGVYPSLGKYMNHQWNYLVVGKGFKSTMARKMYEVKVRSFDFVKEYFSTGLTVDPNSNAASLNKIITGPKNMNLPPVERPLEKPEAHVGHFCSSRRCTCDEISLNNTAPNQKILQIGFIKIKDPRIFLGYGGNLLLRIFPALGTKYVYTGITVEKEFDAINIMEFVSKDAFCESELSQLVQNIIMGASIEAVVGLSAVQV